LSKLNLKNGINRITFILRSKFKGSQSISLNIFLWNYKSKIVISDIDGTITKYCKKIRCTWSFYAII